MNEETYGKYKRIVKGQYMYQHYDNNNENISLHDCKAENLYQYKGYCTQVMECQLWCKKKPYHRECVLIVSLDNITYCWNSLLKERIW